MTLRTVPDRRDAGYVLGMILHVVLLVVALGLVLFLSSRYRARVDLTEDRMFTLTGSTQAVLDRIEDRLRIEAFFSPDSELPATTLEGRRTLRNVLDEYAQRSKGRIVVQYFDPESDVELRKKAERLGVQPQRVQDLKGSTLSSKQLWQGLRFVYGGERQKVIPVIGFSDQPAQYEAVLTPILKTVTIRERPRVGVMQWPSPQPSTSASYQRAEGPKGFNRLLQIDDIRDRYDFTPVDLSKGQLVPLDIETLVLLRPRDLDDRAKYAIDQFVMRGGKLALFVDTDDVSLGQARVMDVRGISFDHPDSTTKFVDQLRHYGAEVSDKALLDSGSPAVPYQFPGDQPGRFFQLQLYPYWFQPGDIDWGAQAEQIAAARGSNDRTLIDTYRQTFEPGIDLERTKGLTVPAFFWPCAVDLADPVPAGVVGHVLFRSSPLSMLLRMPQSVHPIGNDPAQRQSAHQSFLTRILALFASEPPQQHGLMVSLSGEFRSWYLGRPIPPRPGAAKPPAVSDPLAEPIGGPEGQKPDPKDDAGEPQPIGPPVPSPDTESPAVAKADEPEPLLRAAAGAQIVIVADTDFLRDDLIAGEYQTAGGPISALGPVFFLGLLDWLAEDRDLFELRGKRLIDRKQHVIGEAEIAGIPPERLQQEVDERQSALRWRNTLWPPLIFIALGLLKFGLGRARKRHFLSKVGG